MGQYANVQMKYPLALVFEFFSSCAQAQLFYFKMFIISLLQE